MNQQQLAFIEQYRNSLPEPQRSQVPDIHAEHFCADEYNANECARLINEGTKRATCSLKASYEAANDPLPHTGVLTLVLNWDQEPVCIIETNRVEIRSFNQVTAEFAALEGEGDQSLAWWQKAHHHFFTQQAEQEGLVFTHESELVLEYFNKIYPV